MGQFSVGLINKAVPSFRLREYVKSGGGHIEHLPLLKDVYTVFALL